MKYTAEQKESVIVKQESLHKEAIKKRDLLKKEFPIKVEIKDGFLIVESKMNS